MILGRKKFLSAVAVFSIALGTVLLPFKQAFGGGTGLKTGDFVFFNSGLLWQGGNVLSIDYIRQEVTVIGHDQVVVPFLNVFQQDYISSNPVLKVGSYVQHPQITEFRGRIMGMQEAQTPTGKAEYAAVSWVQVEGLCSVDEKGQDPLYYESEYWGIFALSALKPAQDSSQETAPSQEATSPQGAPSSCSFIQ